MYYYEQPTISYYDQLLMFINMEEDGGEIKEKFFTTINMKKLMIIMIIY